jgi:hypothetical protein
MQELRIMNNNKIDHPRKKSKDLADAMCGSVYNAISHTRREKIQEVEVHTYNSRPKVDKEDDKVVQSKPEMTEDIKEYLMNFNFI